MNYFDLRTSLCQVLLAILDYQDEARKPQTPRNKEKTRFAFVILKNELTSTLDQEIILPEEVQTLQVSNIENKSTDELIHQLQVSVVMAVMFLDSMEHRKPRELTADLLATMFDIIERINDILQNR